jgi:hypothetical protein
MGNPDRQRQIWPMLNQAILIKQEEVRQTDNNTIIIGKTNDRQQSCHALKKGEFET